VVDVDVGQDDEVDLIGTYVQIGQRGQQIRYGRFRAGVDDSLLLTDEKVGPDEPLISGYGGLEVYQLQGWRDGVYLYAARPSEGRPES
jgi:hypothetical protein